MAMLDDADVSPKFLSTATKLCKSTLKSLPPDEFAEFSCSKCFDNVYYMNVAQQPVIESFTHLGNKLYNVANHSLEYYPDAFANDSVVCREFLPNESLCQKWRDCCSAARQCCELQTNTSLLGEPFLDKHCPITWDGLLCWDFASPGTDTLKPCPSYYRLGESSDQLASKTCTENGTWFQNELHEWTDYSHCAYGYTGERDVLGLSVHLAIALNSISILLLAIGLILFIKYRYEVYSPKSLV
jgi:hypothetical protein